MPLDGKVALVTGGASGIGAAIVRALAAEGAAVAIADLDADAARACAEALPSGRKAVPVTADCGDVPSIAAMIREVVEAIGSIDILVNNAGLTFQSSLLELDERGWDRVNRVNLKGAFFCMQHAARHMIEQGSGGRIINIASISGRGYADAANGAYVASKGGLISLTWYAAHQLGRHGINVNAICPGITLTPLLMSTVAQRAAAVGKQPAELLETILQRIPIGRANEPQDIAAMAVFLCGDGGRNITGQAFNVDGGLVTN